MQQVLAIAFGGALGAVLRFLISTSLYQWLGRSFPYGTLAVNVLGSLFLGVLAEALMLQRVAFSVELRAAIIVGFFGAFTTFSTFALETIYLLEQSQFAKAILNIVISILSCLLAVWLGLLLGRALLWYGTGAIRISGLVIPYALIIINTAGAFIIGLILIILINRVLPALEHRAAVTVVLFGIYITCSSLYLILYLIEHGHAFESNLHFMLGVLLLNTLTSLTALWLGVLTGEYCH